MFTSLSEGGGPGRTPVGWGHFTDVDEVRFSLHFLQTAVYSVEASLIGGHTRERLEGFQCGGLGLPGYPGGWEDILDDALHLLEAAQPGHLQKESSDGGCTHKQSQKIKRFQEL